MVHLGPLLVHGYTVGNKQYIKCDINNRCRYEGSNDSPKLASVVSHIGGKSQNLYQHKHLPEFPNYQDVPPLTSNLDRYRVTVHLKPGACLKKCV